MKRESSADIDAAAARWAARCDRGPLNTAEEAELRAWIDADRRRLGAFARAQAILAHADRASGLGPAFAARAPAVSAPSRRAVIQGLLAAGLGTLAVGGAWWANERRGLRTVKGEVRLVPLPDGSSVTLNTETVVRVDFDAAGRRVELVSGEALFDVARDVKRPFVVHAGDTSVRAVGTSFTVRRMPDGAVRVVVREGTVKIERTRGETPTRTATANEIATVEPAGQVGVAPVPPGETARNLAWREGMLSFDGVTIAAAVEEFARYSDVRIVVDDPRLRTETVTGLFAAADPRGFAKAVAVSFDAQLVTEAGALHLRR